MTIAKQLSSIRIATLNVHFFQDLKQVSNAQRLAKVLQPLSVDVLALQEAYHTEQPLGAARENRYYFKYLSNVLRLPHLAFGNTFNDFGNGLLSRFPLKRSVNYHTNKVEGHGKRAMLAVTIDHPFFEDNDATLYVTHLDQISENIRLEQLNLLEKHLNQSTGLRLLMGDFNALTLDDYSEDYFRRRIRDVRQLNSWEPPVDLLTKQMKENGYEDCWRQMNNDALDERAITCAYGTRIDYVWKRGELKNGWNMDECRIFSSKDATDHNGILLTMTKTG